MPITFLDEEEDITPLAPPTKRKITFLDEEDTAIAPVTPQAAQPAVTQPSPYKYDPTRFRPKGLVAPKAEQEIGTLEGIANAARNAFDSSRQALDIVGDVTPEEAQNIAKIEFDKQSRKVAPGYDEYQKAEGFDAVLAFAKNPIEVTSNIVAEGLAGSLPALGAGLAAGGVGAAIGAPTGIGAPIGFTAGQVAGTFAGSLATEYGSKILEEMQSEGVDLTKPESIQGFFENEEAVTKARDKAISRGIPVAAFDAISAGIGGKLGRVIGKQFLTKTGEAAAELGVQAGLGGGGEVVGALAAGEPIQPKAVFGEVIGEVGPGAAEIITGRMADRAARVKAEEEKKIKAAAQLSDTLEQNSAPLTAAAVKSTTATTIEQDKLAAQLEEQLDAGEIEKQVSGQLAVTKEPTSAPPAIQSKEEFAAIYSQVAPEELDAAEAGFTEQAATATTEEGRINAQNALEAIKEVKATVTPPAPTVNAIERINQKRIELDNQAKKFGSDSARQFNTQNALREDLPEEQKAFLNDYANLNAEIRNLTWRDASELSPEQFSIWEKPKFTEKAQQEQDLTDLGKLALTHDSRGDAKKAEKIKSIINESKRKSDWTIDSWAERFDESKTQEEINEINSQSIDWNDSVDSILEIIKQRTKPVTPAVPTAQPPITDATQEIIQPEGVRPELETGVEVPTTQAGVSRSVFDTTRGQEEGQVVPPAPAIPESITRAIEERKPISAPFALQYGVDLPRGWRYEDDFFVPPAEPTPAAEVPAVTPTPAAEVAAPVEPTIREVPEISTIVGAEPAAIVEQEPVAPAEPKGTRVAAAAYIAPDGTEYTGPSHLAAMEQAKNEGKITQAEIDAKQAPESRETPQFGYKTDADPFVTRDQAEGIARQSGQLLVEKPATGQLHSNEVALDEFPKEAAVAPTPAPTPVTTPTVTEAVTPAPEAAPTPAGISVGSKVKYGTLIRPYIVEEVIPQTAREIEEGDQFYRIRSEQPDKNGKYDIANVEKKDIKPILGKGKGKGARKMATATRNEEYMRLAQNPEANREQLQRMVDEAAKAAWPNNRLVDSNGNPIRLYHGTFEGNKFTVFRPSETGLLGGGIYLSADKNYAREAGPRVMEVYANISSDRDGEVGSPAGGDPLSEVVIRKPSNVKSADPVTYDDAGNIIPLEERFQPTSPDIRRQAIDTTPEGILITPPDQQYTFNEVFDVAYDMFGGEIPEGFAIVNDSTNKDFEFKAAYVPESGEIIVNLAYLNKNDDIRDAITHELGHYIYGDPEFRAAFDQFIASLSPEARADLDAYVDTAYNKETGEIRLEEKMVRAFVDQFINEEQAPAWRSMLDAIKRFLNKLGFKFNISDRDAISVFTAALNRYKAGEAISREGGARKIIDDLTAMDAEYLAAVERGDMETAQRMVDEAAKKAGYTIAAGHATPFDFNVFDRAKISDDDPDTSIRGFFFSTQPSEFAAYVSGSAERGARGKTKIINAYLNLGKVIGRSEATRIIKQQLKNDPTYQEEGYSLDDSLYFPKNADTVEFVAGLKLTDEKKRQFEETGEIKEGGKVFVKGDPVTWTEPDGSITSIPAGVDYYTEADDYGPRQHIVTFSDLEEAYRMHGESIYIVRDSNQIKRADPVTYDDAGDVIPLSQRFRPTSPDIRRMAAETAPKRRKEQVGGAEREETRYITTPKGILSMNTDVLREKFFDGTSVSPEKTTQAWGYISRLLDIKSGNANELAGEINDTVDADLLAKREAAIAAGEKVDPEEDVSKRIGAAMFSVELMNYAGRLAEQGDTRMLKFMIRNVNSMPTDKYAGDISDAARALRTRLEYDVSGFSAYTTEQKAKVDRTAAVMFGTNKPSKEQSDAVKDAIDESEKTELGNAGEVAGEVEKVEKRTKRKITDKIEKVIGKGSLKGIIQAVKDTPLEKQQERGWIEKVVNDFLINAGLSPEAASTASKLYESLIAERFAAAKQKAFEDNLKKAAPWKNYAARNSRLAKDALNKVQAAIRTGVLDPEKNTESIIAAESGWSGFTKDQYQRIVQLDSIINDPKQDDVTRREAMADLNKVISDAKLPVRFKDALGAYYVGNALMGIPTLTVNIASPIGFTVRNLMTDVSKYAFTDPARIPVAFETFMESMRSWYDQTSYAFKNQIYLNDVVEYLQGQNVLRELFDKGKKQWSEGKYAEGFVNMAVGMTQITGRVLSSLDQGAISMLENQNITRYALEALANTKGKVPKDKLKEFANMVIDTRRKTIAENIANGMSRDRAGVLADLAVKSEVISALAQYDVNPMNVLDASINDALQSVGRNKTLTIKGIEQSQKNISDEGFMSYWPIKLLEMVSAGAGREGSSMQIFAKMLYGFALVPARVFHNVAWFSPYGFIRLGIDKYKKNKGEDSPYAMSLQTEAQYKQRLTEAIAGSVAMLGLAALSSASSDEDDDKKFKIVITGNGPNATTDKQYFDSWMKKWKPYSVHIVVNGNIIPINIGRGGEALFFPIMLAGALDDWKIKQKQNLTKKEPEDLSAIAQMLGSSFFALAQRGPYAAFTKPLFDASKDGRVTEELASQAGFFGKTFIPVLGSSLARNISDLFNDPVDRSSIEGAIYANTPVVGPWLGTKALNALGQPIRADDWGDRLFKLGVPVVFSFPKETPMNELNELILKQGSGPTIPTRANAQKRFGDVLTDKEFETYVREYGRVMSDKMFKNRTKLANMKAVDYDDELEKYARGYSIDGIKIKGASDSAVLAVKRMRQ